MLIAVGGRYCATHVMVETIFVRIGRDSGALRYESARGSSRRATRVCVCRPLCASLRERESARGSSDWAARVCVRRHEPRPGTLAPCPVS